MNLSLQKISSVITLLSVCLYSSVILAVGDRFDISTIDDTPKIRDVQYPDWFSNTFLDLNEDLNDALEQNKKGIIVYFGQKDCAYCEALMEVNFGREIDIIKYTRQHFNVIPVDIWGSRDVTDFNNETLSEKAYSRREEAHFTPSLIFYGPGGQKLLQLRGYYTPYKLRAALEFVVDEHYKHKSLRDYMALADPPDNNGNMNQQHYFKKPPYILDRTRVPGQKPLVVFFEQKSCHACDVLHSGPLDDEITQLLLQGFEVVQLDMWDDKTPVLTPDGQKITASQWARQLNLFYSPSLLFYDESGQEIIRVSSVIRVFRLRGVLEYVLYKGYLEQPSFQDWREDQ